MDDCIFCKIVSGKAPSYKVYENEHVLAFLDIFPSTKGHTLVIPKKHFANLLEAPEKEITECLKAAKNVAHAQMKALGSHGFNILQSNNKEAGQVVFHLHFHVIPRKAEDGLHFGWKRVDGKKEELEETQIALKKAF